MELDSAVELSSPRALVATALRSRDTGEGSPGTGGRGRKEEEAAALAKHAASYPAPLLLLNLLRAPVDTSLYTLGLLLSRIENASHTLVWSHSAARAGEEAAISLVELPRLKTRFKCENGKLESLDYAGSWLSLDGGGPAAAHIVGIPHAIVLQDRARRRSILLPSYNFTRPQVRGLIYRYTPCESVSPFDLLPLRSPWSCDWQVRNQPFATAIALDRSRDGWMSHVRTRFYMYDVHVSGSFLVSKSLAARLYLVLMRLMSRDYVACARLISACATDTPFDGEERWLMSLVKESADDWHPDAHACRLRLALICLECGETQLLADEWKVDKNDQELVSVDLDGYFIQKNNHVSASCRLLPEDEADLMRLLKAAELPKGAPFSAQHFQARAQYLAAVAEATEMDVLDPSADGTDSGERSGTGADGASAADSDAPRVAGAVDASLQPQPRGIAFEAPSSNISVGGKLVIDCIASTAETLSRAASSFTQNVCYARPKAKQRSGARVLDTLDSLWGDKPFGKTSKLGFLLLFEMLTGRVELSLASPDVGPALEGPGGAPAAATHAARTAAGPPAGAAADIEESDREELDDFGTAHFTDRVALDIVASGPSGGAAGECFTTTVTFHASPSHNLPRSPSYASFPLVYFVQLLGFRGRSGARRGGARSGAPRGDGANDAEQPAAPSNAERSAVPRYLRCARGTSGLHAYLLRDYRSSAGRRAARNRSTPGGSIPD